MTGDRQKQSVDQISTTPDDLKRARVLDGAMRVFLAYGYQRVTMDDIAKAAEMSRPALYLLFRNKADIYRAIGERMFEISLRQMAAALAAGGSLGQRLNIAVDTAMIAMMRQIAESPHGAELLDLKNSLAAELIEGWHSSTAVMFAAAIEQEAAKLNVDLAARGLTARGLAELLIDGLEGMKHRVAAADDQRAGARQLIRVIELALKP